ncbi:hypothetical protein B296_00056771 [Ensete ventricosum]|uniref:Uncharacterized protein n=1 Tax=Ensete ventricosum TaxID=4639 RepID=A0A426XBH2_ENSVE|nr:hypothetical protein B296_00056771 [Ensete ventricosum]
MENLGLNTFPSRVTDTLISNAPLIFFHPTCPTKLPASTSNWKKEEQIKGEINGSPDGPFGRSLVLPLDIKMVQPDQGVLAGRRPRRRIAPTGWGPSAAAGGGRMAAGEGRRAQGGATATGDLGEARRALAPLVHHCNRERAGDRRRCDVGTDQLGVVSSYNCVGREPENVANLGLTCRAPIYGLYMK